MALLSSKPQQRPLSFSQVTAPSDDQFVEDPSYDFFCPVQADLLLQPHLTSCCGNHLSQEAVIRLQREGNACPLCTTRHWSSMLNKNFRRQVNALRVFCHHKNRGCGWQGKLSDLERHVQSCLMSDAPLKSPLYVLLMIMLANMKNLSLGNYLLASHLSTLVRRKILNGMKLASVYTSQLPPVTRK